MITFANDFLIYYFALSITTGFVDLINGLTALFTILVLEGNNDGEWIYLISAKLALGLHLVVIWVYLELYVVLLVPEVETLVKLAEL